MMVWSLEEDFMLSTVWILGVPTVGFLGFVLAIHSITCCVTCVQKACCLHNVSNEKRHRSPGCLGGKMSGMKSYPEDPY